ncbi:uroporphyrinogen-III synthase [Fretibacter rubidus]|uniref:uroporphyrinogen-III synthase n=1 Tax=Fretibacter rubidus TaxID=570162 RepID=UPI003529EBA5
MWITRTAPNADASAKRFEVAGFKTIVAPLLTLSSPTTMPALPPHDAILIFTSSNGVDAFCARDRARHYPVVTVGDKTAQHCLEAGFSRVRSAGGRADDVTALILDEPDKTRPYWHMAGRHVRGTIVEDLKAAGLSARRETLYASAPVLKRPDIDVNAVDIIALYSPLAAQTLAGFAPDISRITTLSISPVVDAALGSLTPQSRLIAKAPNEDAMLESLIALEHRTL